MRLTALFSRTTRVSRYQKGKTKLDFTEARDNEWQWHQLGHMQDCTSLQTDNHASTLPLSFLQAGCPSCRPTNSVKALKALTTYIKSQTDTRQLHATNEPLYHVHSSDIIVGTQCAEMDPQNTTLLSKNNICYCTNHDHNFWNAHNSRNWQCYCKFVKL